MAKVTAAKKGERVRSYPLEKDHGWSSRKAETDGIVIVLDPHESLNGGCFISLDDLEDALSAFYTFK